MKAMNETFKIELWGKKKSAWGYGSVRCPCGTLIFLHLNSENGCDNCGWRVSLKDKHTIIMSHPVPDTKENKPMAYQSLYKDQESEKVLTGGWDGVSVVWGTHL